MVKMIFSPLFIRKLDRIYDYIAEDYIRHIIKPE
jgi:hypothetical protein